VHGSWPSRQPGGCCITAAASSGTSAHGTQEERAQAACIKGCRKVCNGEECSLQIFFNYILTNPTQTTYIYQNLLHKQAKLRGNCKFTCAQNTSSPLWAMQQEEWCSSAVARLWRAGRRAIYACAKEAQSAHRVAH